MDRNSAIGLSLIAVILLAYLWFAPKPEPQAPPVGDTTTVVTADTIRSVKPAGVDSTTIRSYGLLGSALAGEAKTTTVENEDLALEFSSHGNISKVELKKFKTYYQQPLILAQPSNNTFALNGKLNGNDIDLYKLNYTENVSKVGDTTVVEYTARVSDNAFVRHTYKVPAKGYEVKYNLAASGITLGDNLAFNWHDRIPLQEKVIDDSRIRTTITYYTANDGFDEISESSMDLETEALSTPVRWVSIRQKFFLSAIIADKAFTSGEVSTFANTMDTTLVKDASVRLMIPTTDLSGKGAGFKYYFGPNDYKTIDVVAPDFRENVDLGWPPVTWVNKFVIVPLFQFLELFVGNYGVIIMILVIIIRLLLTPLSYKSYLGMAKMRLLKPELDLIKQKNGDNMAQTQQDQMKLYSQAGVSPFSGCIPLLLQTPILLAMFYFFPVAIEFRQEPFLWAEDLSTYDSIMTLPFTIPFYGNHVSLFVLLMTISTLFSIWQNNQMSTVEGPMKSVSYIMPVVFLFILNSFSASLSFYYFISNVVGFLQQAVIRRFVDEDKIMKVMDDHKKKMMSTGGTGKKSNFMARLEEAMKASEEARRKNARK